MSSDGGSTLIAFVPTPFQAAIWPSSVAKMNRPATSPVPASTLKSLALPLKTTPVGGPGTVTTSPSLAPVLPLYSVDLLVPLSLTHHGDVELATMPQPFTRSVSGGVPRSDCRMCRP